MLRFKQRSRVRKIAAEQENPNIADRFAKVMVRLHFEHDLEPDVLAAAEDVLRVFRAREMKRVGIDPEVDSRCIASRAFGPSWLLR
jgi:hypothetical protein